MGLLLVPSRRFEQLGRDRVLCVHGLDVNAFSTSLMYVSIESGCALLTRVPWRAASFPNPTASFN
eukprot:67262-Prorocentrum_lima.AAC.1